MQLNRNMRKTAMVIGLENDLVKTKINKRRVASLSYDNEVALL